MADGPGARGGRRLLAALTVGLLVGCSYTDREPGLFGRTPSEPPPSEAQRTPATLNSDLPVVGDEVWTTADGTDVTMRIAVHAVRRAPGSTVLDWSITPLSGPGLSIGDRAPADLDLGLQGPASETRIALLDSRGRVFRPLRRERGLPGCLCTPVATVQRQLVVGHTALLQLAFPPLPAEIATIDVDVATVPIFVRVPVTPQRLVPLATSPTDLGRPFNAPPPYLAGPGFEYPGPGGQRLVVAVERVIAAPSHTTLQWRVRSLSRGPGLSRASAPPFAEATGGPTRNRAAASGPTLGGEGLEPLRSRLVSAAVAGRDATECLCSDPRRWTSALREPDQVATLVTTFPPLPTGQQEVVVTFPGLGGRRAVVERAGDASTRSAGPVRARVAVWRERGGPTTAWSLDQWPTPVPDRAMVGDYRAIVDRVVR